MKGHIRRRGKSGHAWEIKVDAGRDVPSGKRDTRYITFHGTKRQAQDECARIIHEIKTGQFVDPSKLTVGEWLRQWIELARNEVSPKTLERYSEIIDKHLIPNLGALHLGKLQAVYVERYYAAALKQGRCDGEGGLSAQTVRHHDRVLNVAMKRARALRLIAANPIEDVTRPKVERGEVEYLDTEDAVSLIGAAAGTRLHAPIFLALATGLRRGELLALRWSDLDLDRGSLTVAQSLEQTKDGLRFKAPKTKKSRRTIALSPSAVDLLRAHKAQQAKERLVLGLGKDGRALVFTRYDGSVVNPRNFSKEFCRLVIKAKIRPVTFHGLRHTHFTNLLREGVHPKIASERAGHASIATTMDIYSHAVPGLQEDAALRIDGALRGLLDGG